MSNAATITSYFWHMYLDPDPATDDEEVLGRYDYDCDVENEDEDESLCDGSGMIVVLDEPRGHSLMIRPDAMVRERECPGCGACREDREGEQQEAKTEPQRE